MRTQIIGKNVSITNAMQQVVDKKLERLAKYDIIPEETIIRVVVRVYPVDQKIEINVPTELGLIRTETVSDTMYSALDKAVDRLEDQVRRLKTKKEARREKAVKTPEPEEDIIIRTKKIEIELMSAEDAIEAMERIDHDFYLYIDDETRTPSVVYRRRDGGYGLLESQIR